MSRLLFSLVLLINSHNVLANVIEHYNNIESSEHLYVMNADSDNMNDIFFESTSHPFNNKCRETTFEQINNVLKYN
jgi:hypothetical protein